MIKEPLPRTVDGRFTQSAGRGESFGGDSDSDYQISSVKRLLNLSTVNGNRRTDGPPVVNGFNPASSE
ncbi:hypothetical protein GCM10025331_51720 [Actinoplanes utahensis]|nr:hypothetical protein Aut01nite_66010 [Actinoplanes utahensis]